MRIIFTSIVGTGHFTPLLPYATEMQRRGHEVRFAAPEELAPKIAAVGLTHVPVGRPNEEEREAFSAKFDHLPQPERVPHVMSGLFLGMLPRAAFPKLMEFAKSWQPELIVREAGEYAGALAAEVLGIPHMRVSVSNGHTLKKAIAPFDELRREVGLVPDSGTSLRRARAFSAFPASMEPPGGDGALLPQYRVASATQPASLEVPDWVSSGERPHVYMTFGTAMGSSQEAKTIFRAALDAVSTMDLMALMTTGPSMDVEALGTIPDNVVLRDFVPQNDVFPYVSAVLCHGGSGSVLGALAAGRPLVVTPIGADQPENAKAVEATGAGRAVVGPDASAIAAALRDVLTDPRYAEAAQRIAAEMAEQPGIDAAVDEMLRLASAKRM